MGRKGLRLGGKPYLIETDYFLCRGKSVGSECFPMTIPREVILVGKLGEVFRRNMSELT